MKHLKSYENAKNSDEREQLLSSAAWYLEDQQPISTDDGFIECVFDTDELFCFDFSVWTDDDDFNKFYDFLKSNKLKIYKEFSYGNNNDIWEIQVKISEKKIKEYASIYDNSQKYNL